MRNEMRNWLLWYKKQIGFDGLRLDGVKYFNSTAAEDFLYNAAFNSGWASNGESQFAVGDFSSGTKSQLDNWSNSVLNRAGTFDSALREALHGLAF